MPTTTPTQIPQQSTNPTELTNPSVEQRPEQKQLNIQELLFSLSCYCYIFSALKVYDSINKLDESLLVIKNISKENIEPEQNIEMLNRVQQATEEDAKQFADDPDFTPPPDTIDPDED